MNRYEKKPTNYNRRQSMAAKSQRLFDLGDDFVQSFLNQKGLTPEEVRDAFELVSSDRRRITKDDVSVFFQKYFGSSKMSPKQQKWLASWKEEIGPDTLSHLLLSKQNAVKPFDEAFEWFSHGSPAMDEKLVKEICKRSSPTKTLHKTDMGVIRKKYDLDKDGQIGLEDFKRMGLV